MMCCGKKQKTPFCAFCGKPQLTSPHASLLQHCRDKLKSAKTGRRHHANHVGWSAQDKEKVLKGQDRLVEKWQTWVNFLESIVDGSATKG